MGQRCSCFAELGGGGPVSFLWETFGLDVGAWVVVMVGLWRVGHVGPGAYGIRLGVLGSNNDVVVVTWMQASMLLEFCSNDHMGLFL